MKTEDEIQERLDELKSKKGLREAEEHGRIEALQWVLDDGLGTSPQYEDGVVDTLEALLTETHATQTQSDILFAAYEVRGISKAHVDKAREKLYGLDGNDD
jgi:hypothetical protein